MKPQPIPTTRTPIPYTPFPQDADANATARQTQIDAMKRDLAALKITVRDGKADSEPSDPAIAAQIAALESVLDQETKNLDQEIAAIRAKYPEPMSFTLKIPTSVEREQLQSRFVAIGLTPVTTEMMRATLIEELFETDWDKGSPEANEVEAENLANFLDGIWQREEAQGIAMARWQEQEVERVMDEDDGAPARPRSELPPRIISVRDAARSTLLLDRMMKSSQKLRDLAAKAADFTRRNALAMVRIHVLAARNIDVEIQQDPYLKVLPVEQAEALRDAMDDASWHDLVQRIDAMYKLDGAEEKNSVSPLGKPSVPDGSLAPIGDTANSDGNSTISSITPAPAAEFATIIALSSDSTSDSDPVVPSTEASTSQTAEA